MEDSRQYLQIMIDSLRNKIEVLNAIAEQNKKQTELLKVEPFDWDAFDVCVDHKTRLIDRLDLLDDGFESMYNHIKDSLESKESKSLYRDEIVKLKELIASITDLSVSIQASESRNKQSLENVIKQQRGQIKSQRTSSRAAMDYYKAMSQTGVIAAQFYDNKK